MIMRNYFFFLAFFSMIVLITPNIQAEAASSNPNLFISAENSEFSNHFSGSMVIEVVIRDNDIRDKKCSYYNSSRTNLIRSKCW